MTDYLQSLPTGAHRFLYVYERASQSEQLNGRLAYERYHTLLRMVAECTGHTLAQACGVFSALSPNNDYMGNLRDAFALLSAHKAGKTLDQFKVSTYGKNKTKAWEIAGGGNPDELIRAQKTLNFYHNCLDPKDPAYVTIDGHMANIWKGEKRPLQTRNKAKRAQAITHKVYNDIADDVRGLAANLRLSPCELQAILWLTWRRIHGITTTQLSFWDRDVEIIGAGFKKL